MSFSTFLKEIEAEVKSGFTSTKSELLNDVENLASNLKADIKPVAYAILQSSVAAAEVAGGTWNFKLLAAITTASAAFARQGIPIILNDMVAAVTAIVGQMNAAKTKLSA